jgi:hypothetical protein
VKLVFNEAHDSLPWFLNAGSQNVCQPPRFGIALATKEWLAAVPRPSSLVVTV